MGYSEYGVRVAPDAKRQSLEVLTNGVISISVKEPAEEGRANQKVLELLAHHFSVPVKNVMLVRGSRHQSKIVRIYHAR